jgi:hypothetical protein
LNKKIIIIAVVIVAVAVFVIWLFSGGGFNPNAPHVNLNLTSNGYSNTLNDTPNYHFDITVTNSGTLTARNVRFMVTFYGANHAIIGSRESASVGDIPAGATMSFSIDVQPPIGGLLN